ncbi:iron-sulfur cluster assembly scaffold protein [Legionella fairfieldensis]|uniref:iron-sulfur cluster assembly scaffold protein n=1 Tax=Legionella fairfieldensis TaxID=45064 RepID=UPI000490836F|nr:iron-sulfur cluster assembly scaffold protein [Legionella fairfieldensis]
MMYNEIVESCFFRPEHVGSVDLTQPLSVYYRCGEAGRGDICDFYLLCDEKGLVLQARFKAYGNPYLIAAAEWLCQHVEGSLLETHPCFDYASLVKELAIPANRYFVALQIEDGYKELVTMMKVRLKGGEK